MSLRDALLPDPVPMDYNFPIVHDHSFTKAPSGWNTGAASVPSSGLNSKVQEITTVVDDEIGRASCRERVCYPV